MQTLTDDGRQIVNAAAGRHGFSADAVATLLAAIAAGGGRQAQFSHAELGGMGQWSEGGMIMIGDMFNAGLKSRVDALACELATVLRDSAPFVPLANPSGIRWPVQLGYPAATGSQNDLHYAVFPAHRRLVIDQGGRMSVFDTGDHAISGFSQAQGDGQSIAFISQNGPVQLHDLPQVRLDTIATDAAIPAHAPVAASDDLIFSRIERLAELLQKDIITQDEFDSKKAELLARL